MKPDAPYMPSMFTLIELTRFSASWLLTLIPELLFSLGVLHPLLTCS